MYPESNVLACKGCRVCFTASTPGCGEVHLIPMHLVGKGLNKTVKAENS